MKVDEYVAAVAGQIRCKLARDGVAQEIRGHVEDQKEYFIAQGMDESEAEVSAVREMGDPVEAGVALDRIHRPQMLWGLIGLILLLSAAGYLVQYLLQVSFYQASFIFNNTAYLVWILVGGLIMTGVCFFDYTRIGSWAKELTVILLALFVLGRFVSNTLNGISGWIIIGSLTLNMRVLIFIFVPLYGGILYRYRGQGYAAIIKAMLWMIPAPLIALSYPSLTTAVMLVLCFVMVLAAAVWKRWFAVSRKLVLAVTGGVLCLSPAAGYWLIRWFGADYQVDRMMTVFDRSADSSGYLFEMIRNIIAASSMVGPGQLSIDGLIPGSSDFVLIYIIACYGILAAVLLTGLMLILFFCFLRTSLRQKNQLGVVMGTGCVAVLLIQMIFCVLGNVGILPLFAAYCPFITYGGSGTLLTYFLLGLLLSICRYQHVLPEVGGRGVKALKWQIRLVIERNDR